METGNKPLSYKILDGIRLEYQKDQNRREDPHHYPHTHEFCELYFYLGGSCSYMVETGLYRVTDGTVIFTRPGELHSVQIDAPCTYERCYYQIHPHAFDFLEDHASHSILRCFFERPYGAENAAVLPMDVMKRCHDRLEHSIRILKNGGGEAKPLALADLLETLADVNTVFDKRQQLQLSPPRSALVGGALQYINENLCGLRSTDELAAKLYVSREYLSRSFSRVMGVTLNRYITIKRVELAKVMLQNSHTLDEICEQCGFTDYSYFIRVFRQETGLTPMRYRRSALDQAQTVHEGQTS